MGLKMLSYYHYWQALRRLESSSKTVEMMEPDVPNMVQAQHEMIQREVEYYREEAGKFTLIVLTLAAFAGIMLILYTQGMIHV
ncbi:hypothetical protein EBU71_00960 [bacterium]|nr:hypothetical protein [Candidatus Elulimicrobium humile]